MNFFFDIRFSDCQSDEYRKVYAEEGKSLCPHKWNNSCNLADNIMNRTGRTYYKSDENRNGIILLLFNSLYRNHKTKDNYADSRKHRNKEDIINSNVITSESKEGNKEGNCYNYSNDEGNFCFLSIIKLVKEEHQKHHTCRQTRSCERTLQVVIDDCVFRPHIEEVKDDKEETAYKIQEGCV